MRGKISKPGGLNIRPASTEGFNSLSVPVYRGSTITYSDYESFTNRGSLPRSAYTYGLAGTPTTRTLQNCMSELEGAHDTFLTPSGLSAATVTMIGLLKAGDVLALPDNVYPPVRRFAKDTLEGFGVTTIYYDPNYPEAALGEGVKNLRLIWVEAPGSVTMEIPDFARLRALADQHGAKLGFDNSWASPFLCRPLDFGADVVVEALTKYLSGHSDVLMGSISVADEEMAKMVHKAIRSLGIGVSPDDCFMVLRGMESAQLRLEHVGQKALTIAEALTGFDMVEEVLHPGLNSFATHENWRKQFKGSSGLFSVVLRGEADNNFGRRFDSLDTFKLGASWGGTHSILAPVVLSGERSVDRRYCGRPIVRVSCGLEPVDGLLADLSRALAA